MNNKKVYVVIELHKDCPKIRGIFEDEKMAEKVAYEDTLYYRNIIAIPMNQKL